MVASRYRKLSPEICDETTNTESPDNLFSENLFGTSLIEFEYLIVEIGLPRIHEIWSVYFIDKKSKNFIVLYDNAAHLCTCLTLIIEQWRKGFGIMKKALNLAISTGRAEELYEMHSRLVNEMEIEIARNEGRTIEQVSIQVEPGQNHEREDKARQCGICHKKGHNARTCTNRKP
ncbi:hypothetical protein C2G38_2034806 [Gigaspora rosea]|uniref:CCHC-type domain-containing protein n=1 Tax=Gigaspora rosea TaxID=44941 RepID=A0A397VG37_9GLOM|nr:hypothetical protein C2G38_2034806 [Gigaspora rosea]